MTDKILQGLKRHGAETAIEMAAIPFIIDRRYDIPMHRAEMLEEMSLLFEHSYTQTTGKWFLSGMYPQVGLQVPTHTKLFATIRTAVLTGTS